MIKKEYPKLHIQISRLNALSTPAKPLYKAPLPPCSSKKKGEQNKQEGLCQQIEPLSPSTSHPRTTSNKKPEQSDLGLSKTHTLKHTHVGSEVSQRTVHGSPGPAVGRHGGRAAPGLGARQAPQVRLLLALFLLLLPGGDRRHGRDAGRGGGGRRAAASDAQHHHAPPLGAVRRHVAAQRVQLRAVVASQRRPGLALRRSHDAQGRGLEEAAPERQDGRGRRRRRPRHAEEPHRLRLGGDQLAGPVKQPAGAPTQPKTSAGSELKGGSEHKHKGRPYAPSLFQSF